MLPNARFIPEIKTVTLVERISPTQTVWSLEYHFPPPISPRIFTVLHTAVLSTESPRTGFVYPFQDHQPITATDPRFTVSLSPFL